MGTQRLDLALVHRGLARSRNQAARLIAEGRVRVAGQTVGKPAAPVDDGAALLVDPGDDWASRGAHKLIGALDTLGLAVDGRRAVDAGASHGGFTDVLLRRGAAAVAALDVGTAQLVPRLAGDPRVHVHDHVNVRDIDAAFVAAVHGEIGGAADLIVADLSFISLTLVLPELVALAAPDADLLPMVKPQFEVGRGRLGAHGVVHSARHRAEAVTAVAAAAAELGWGIAGAAPSALPGPTGNIEYFLHLRRDAPLDADRATRLVDAAVSGGPR